MFSASTRVLLTGSAHKALSSDTHQRQIDERIAELRDEIRVLNICRNTRSSTVGLPPEILSYVFTLVAQLYRGVEETPSRPTRDRPHPHWIWVTHVCSHWRRVALECVALWTDLAFESPAIVELMLSRARSASLTVAFTTAHQNHSQMHDVLRRVLSQSDRLRSIKIRRCLGDSLELPPILGVCSRTAPCLKAVSICDDGIPAVFEIPPEFLAGGSPALESLELHRCRVSSWDLLPLGTSLTSLKLSVYSSSDDNPARPSWLELSASLNKMCFLQTLHLSHYLPHSDWQSFQLQSDTGLTSSISLQRLSNLKLSDTSTTVIIDFLKLISQPHTSEIEVIFHGIGALDFLHPLFVQLRASQQIREYGPAQELQVEGPNYFETVTNFGFHSPEHPDRRLVLRFRGPVPTPGQILVGLEEEVDYSSIYRLQVDLEDLHEETWVLMFSSLTTLREISLDGSVDGFSTALSIANRVGGFPALTNLTLYGINFRMEEFPLSLDIIPALYGRPESTPSIDLCIEGALNCTQVQVDALSEQLPTATVLWDGYYEEFHDDTTDSTNTSEEEGESD